MNILVIIIGLHAFLAQVSENFVITEWDIALSREDRSRFEKYCLAEPGRIHVVPYRLYIRPLGSLEHSTQIWWPPHIREDDPFCFYFGFGLTYIPLTLIKKYLIAIREGLIVTTDKGHPYILGSENRSTDGTFSWWHATVTGMEPVPVHWDIRPVHLHYEPYLSTLDIM